MREREGGPHDFGLNRVEKIRRKGQLAGGMGRGAAGEFRELVMKGFVCHSRVQTLPRRLPEPPHDVKPESHD